MEQVILVNAAGKRIGLAEKTEAHQKGLLHRAFSIFLYNDAGEMLLQQRAITKYHFAGLWSNACCSHPRSGENILSAARRRLTEELNITCSLKSAGTVTYKVHDDLTGLTEHEFDYLITGKFDGEIGFNIKEVAAVRWLSSEALRKEIEKHPEKFTPWFLYIMKESPRALK